MTPRTVRIIILFTVMSHYFQPWMPLRSKKEAQRHKLTSVAVVQLKAFMVHLKIDLSFQTSDRQFHRWFLWGGTSEGDNRRLDILLRHTVFVPNKYERNITLPRIQLDRRITKIAYPATMTQPCVHTLPHKRIHTSYIKTEISLRLVASTLK